MTIKLTKKNQKTKQNHKLIPITNQKIAILIKNLLKIIEKENPTQQKARSRISSICKRRLIIIFHSQKTSVP